MCVIPREDKEIRPPGCRGGSGRAPTVGGVKQRGRRSSPMTSLARLADLSYRRRGRMLLAWVAVLAAVVVFAPRVAGEFDEDYLTPGSESKAAATLVFLVAFGSVVAAGLPLLTALFGLGISATLIGVVAAVLDVPDWAPAVAGLLGIGVGIDYTLLILTRFRSALAAGADRRAATIETIETAGRSVLIAGTTVVISILGLFLVGIPSLRGVAVAASLAVLVVMAASVTLLPALIAFLGAKVNRLHIPGFGRALRQGGDGALAARWSRSVQRRPWTAAIAGTVVLLVLAAPALGLRLGFPDAGNNPAEMTTRQAYDLISEGFGPGANGPLFLAADLSQPRATAELEGLAERLGGAG